MSVSHQGAVVAGRVKRLAAAAVVAILFSVTPSGSPAGQGDCGQPVTDGLIASATDCLFILRASVGLNACPYDCICDTDGSSTISATDALACLQRAVGLGTHLLCACETPALLGLDPVKPPILPITVQAAYNDDTMFFHISWEGDRGDTHDYLHFTDGAWRNEGGHRRDGQATLDNDPARGATDRNSTIYESRATFMIDDPNGPNAVELFDIGTRAGGRSKPRRSRRVDRRYARMPRLPYERFCGSVRAGSARRILRGGDGDASTATWRCEHADANSWRVAT